MEPKQNQYEKSFAIFLRGATDFREVDFPPPHTGMDRAKIVDLKAILARRFHLMAVEYPA
jgi:hypothetical protein